MKSAQALWLPFVGNYRTFLISPDPDGRAIMAGVIHLQQCA